MPVSQPVLLLGGSGRTGRRVLRQLLERDIKVRAILRSTSKLPPDIAQNPNLSVIEASVLALSAEELRGHLDGCAAVISCLGHVINLKGIFGSPRDLVTEATKRVCHAVEALKPEVPIKFILMSSVSVHRAKGQDTRRGTFERAFLWLLCALLPPAKDNQRAADFLIQHMKPGNAFVHWTAVRPDALLEGDISEYAVHEGLVNSLFAPGSSNMANVAHFMCELATSPNAWDEWAFKLPVIVNAATPGQTTT